MSIYLPDNLKVRMDAAGDLEWSQIAQRAFNEAILRRITMETNDMTAVIERLKASKEREEEQSRAEGELAGERWARQSAEYSELLAVTEAESSEEVVFALFGGREAYNELDYRDEIRPHLEKVFGSADYNVEFVEAFQDGAIKVWNAIADQVG